MNAAPAKRLDAPARRVSSSAFPLMRCGASFRSTSSSIAAVPAFDIVAHRVLWSLPVPRAADRDLEGMGRRCAPRSLGRARSAFSTVTALLIGGNWLLYVYAVTSGHILAASFGYYLNPLANVLLGRFALKERLSRLQWIAVAIAAAGISVLAAGALGQLWISLTLCVSFALYGLLRKIVPADAITGLAVETAILFPLAMPGSAGRQLAGAAGDGLRPIARRCCSCSPELCRPRRCCCSPPPPSACPIRRWACCSSSRRRCSS